MGTRGLFGFRKNDTDKLVFNRNDSYPENLGRVIVEFCKSNGIVKLNEIYDRIELVNINKLQNEKELIKSIDDLKKGLKYTVDESEFIKDSLFCEYAYIINLDDNTLEFWVGHQTEKQKDNRYGDEAQILSNAELLKSAGLPFCYYPCSLKASFPLGSLEKDTVSQMRNIVDKLRKGEN